MKKAKESREAKLKNLEKRLEGLSDEDVLKVFLHLIRDRFLAKEAKGIAILQEIARELGQAGI